ncbi:MAG TPA: M48 family metallopeptidase [Gemmatimonadaceae bacterium]|jgi:Zn-dependent protease with chaperone function|nr:M48 family metallopeptidase [Gemmatimonadaceae bacterium]
MADRKVLTQISPTAWEHPADRAALQTLRAIPGFDDLVRKILGFFGERGIRHLFLANAVKIGPRQRPKLNTLYTEVLETMDWPERPDLYVTQTPFANAGAVGFERPFIVLNSGALALLDREEQRVILGHELGHIMSGHATYRTIALILLWIGSRNLPFLAGMALLPIELALFEWYRKSELSSDRAGMLASQDPNASMRMFLKFAGGGARYETDGGLPAEEEDTISLDEFLVQAREYEEGGSAIDTIFKVLNVAFRTHPFNTVRAGELQRWMTSGQYERILGGDYPRRGDDTRPLSQDYAEAAGYYGDQTRGAVDEVAAILRGARDAFTGAFRGPTK